MANSKQSQSKRDRLWAEAKQRCRLNREDVRIAKEMGLNPRSLIKNIPSPSQQWKLPVKQWIYELYEKRTGKVPVKRRVGVQLPKLTRHSSEDPVPLPADADERELIDSGHNTRQTTIEDWEEYAAALWDGNSLQSLSDSSPLREIREKDQQSRQRQKQFRLAAEYVAQALGQISGVEKVVLFGSVACPLQDEKPRYRKYRHAGIPMLHICKDIDLAVWVSQPGCLRAMQKASSRALKMLFEERNIGVAHHQVDIFIIEPGSDRYLGRLCSYKQCPKGKLECRVPGCGSTPLLRQHEDFRLCTSALLPDRSIILV